MSKYPIHYYKKSHHYSDDMTERRDREAFALIMEGGAVEGWRTKALSADPMFAPTGYYGGIEIHSREPLYEGHQQADFHCDLINANCYHDGSSMAFDHIERLFDLPEGMFTVLRSWQPDEWQVVDAEVVTEISKAAPDGRHHHQPTGGRIAHRRTDLGDPRRGA